MPEYPEHDKLTEIKDQSEAIGVFLDFGLPRLKRNGGHVAICEYHEKSDQPKWVHRDTGEAVDLFDPDAILNLDWHPEGYFPVGMTIEAILASYFDIDRDRLEAEKRQMLDELREANA